MANLLVATFCTLLASALTHTLAEASSRVSVNHGGYSYEYTSGDQGLQHHLVAPGQAHPVIHHHAAPAVHHVARHPLHQQHGLHHLAQARSFHLDDSVFRPRAVADHEDIFVGAASAQPPTFAFPSPLISNNFISEFGPGSIFPSGRRHRQHQQPAALRRPPQHARALAFPAPAPLASPSGLEELQQQEAASRSNLNAQDIRPDPEDQAAGSPTKYQAAKAAADFAKRFHRQALVKVNS